MERLEQWKLKKAQEKAHAEGLNSEQNTPTASGSVASTATPSAVLKGSNVSSKNPGTGLTDTDSSVKRNFMKPLQSMLHKF